ncbi:AbrB/MazE/SpoVT family DNA-binding domain-containing protein [Candidatus Falkowbacteria bacterium]|nr:AbrB/MazE/SpoVT family DNA-binding domain-containing protein [Candidatus Falkowbacteria bacterium]
MKLQSQVSRVYGKTKYEKTWVVIPQKVLEILKWKKGQELDGEVKDGKLIIKKKK